MCIHWLPRNNWINWLQGQTGWGVYLFFVLSGFLITRILMRCRTNAASGIVSTGFSLRQFYVRRILRIFPLYYGALAVAAALNVQAVRQSIHWQALYLTNHYFFVHRAFIGPTTPFWSLSVEEQFYLAWPFVILLLPTVMLIPAVVLAFVAGTICRSAAMFSSNNFYLILTPCCINYLASGALVAVVESVYRETPSKRAILIRIYLITGLILAGGEMLLRLWPSIPHQRSIIDALRHMSASLLFGYVVARLATGVTGLPGRVLRFGPAVYLGKISYGLYVYHSFVKWTLNWFERRLVYHMPHLIVTAITQTFLARFLVTVALASLSWYLLERPLNDLKRFFPYAGVRNRPLLLEERGIPVPQP